MPVTERDHRDATRESQFCRSQSNNTNLKGKVTLCINSPVLVTVNDAHLPVAAAITLLESVTNP